MLTLLVWQWWCICTETSSFPNYKWHVINVFIYKMAILSLGYCTVHYWDKVPDIYNVKEKMFISAYTFRDFGLLLAGPKAERSWQKGMGEKSCFPQGIQEAEWVEYYHREIKALALECILPGYASTDLLPLTNHYLFEDLKLWTQQWIHPLMTWIPMTWWFSNIPASAHTSFLGIIFALNNPDVNRLVYWAMQKLSLWP